MLWVTRGSRSTGELEIPADLGTLDEYRWSLLTRYRARLNQGATGDRWPTRARPRTPPRGSAVGQSPARAGLLLRGALIWMEADAIIRTESDGSKSIEDFVHAFFRADEPTDDPNPYSRDVIDHLNDVVDYDWRRSSPSSVDNVTGKPLAGVEKLGYSIQYTEPHRPEPLAHRPARRVTRSASRFATATARSSSALACR